MTWSSNFQPFSSQGTYKLITKVLQHTEKYISCQPDKKNRYNFDSFTPNGYCCVGCCHFLFDNLREKSAVPLTKWSRVSPFRSSCGTPVEHRWLGGRYGSHSRFKLGENANGKVRNPTGYEGEPKFKTTLEGKKTFTFVLKN